MKAFRSYFAILLFMGALIVLAFFSSALSQPGNGVVRVVASASARGTYISERVVAATDTSAPDQGAVKSSSRTPSPRVNNVAEEYKAALERWRSLNIDEYEMVVHRGTYAPRVAGDGTYTVRVRKGIVEVVSFALPYTGEAATPPPWVDEEYLSAFDIDKQFERLEWLNNPEATIAPSDEYERLVTFDSTYGFPSHVSMRPLRVTHGGGYTSIADFKPLTMLGSPVPQLAATPGTLP
jgi:hypothetical protein